MLFFLATQLVFIINVFKNGSSSHENSPFDFLTIELAILGVLMMVMGNFMPKARKNAMFGLRTFWSMANDRTWLASNRFGGALFCVGGLVVTLAAFLLEGMTVLWVAFGTIVVITIAAVVYSYVTYRKWGRVER